MPKPKRYVPKHKGYRPEAKPYYKSKMPNGKPIFKGRASEEMALDQHVKKWDFELLLKNE